MIVLARQPTGYNFVWRAIYTTPRLTLALALALTLPSGFRRAAAAGGYRLSSQIQEAGELSGLIPSITPPPTDERPIGGGGGEPQGYEGLGGPAW